MLKDVGDKRYAWLAFCPPSGGYQTYHTQRLGDPAIGGAEARWWRDEINRNAYRWIVCIDLLAEWDQYVVFSRHDRLDAFATFDAALAYAVLAC